MDLATPHEMKMIDEETISSAYSKSIDLMERAGKAVAREAELLTRRNEIVSIFCGGGNNGGDGLVAARYLLQKKRKVLAYLFGKKSEIKGDPEKNLKRFLKLKGKVFEITNNNDLKKLEECRSSNLLIDALFGIGLKGKVTGPAAQGINFINSLKKRVIAVDVPSGLNAEKGIASGPCVEAFVTLTFGLGKPGLFLAPGINFAGKVKIVDIGLSPESIRKKKLLYHLLDREEMQSLLPRRRPDSHKGDCGHVLVIAGSVGLTGAACLASSGALRSGAGLVTLGLPESLNVIAASKLTEAMTLPLPETKEKSISSEALSAIVDFSLKCRAVAIGPGLSRNDDTGSLVLELIKNLTVPMVIDADAIFALSSKVDVLKHAKVPLILTPHPGEMAGLIGKRVVEIKENRVDIVRNFSKEYNVIVVLKGAGTVIADGDADIYINPTGNPSLSSGGTGDVLTGMIASFLAQGLKPLDAAKLGTYIHGLAADDLSLSRGPLGIIATDILNQIPLSIYNLSKTESPCHPSSSG